MRYATGQVEDGQWTGGALESGGDAAAVVAPEGAAPDDGTAPEAATPPDAAPAVGN